MKTLLLILLLFALPSGAAHASELVHAEPGELPVILTAPHGGMRDVPGCEERTRVGARFVDRPDAYTDRLVRGIADELKRVTGKAPYLVMAHFHRKYIDANRRADEAYALPGCTAAYEAYHAAIRRSIDEMREKFPRAMLFDIHGQAAYRDSILRGTRYGRTVQALLARAGASAVTGPESVFGRFAAMGYSIVPANDSGPTDRVEAKNYTGGHTVEIYGSQRADGIDAMQLEFGRDLREGAALEKTAKDTAQAIAVFYERFLR
jgi:N-formylglutamate amidohydrolase